MRAWIAEKAGPENLKLVNDVPIPEIKGDYDILVKILTTSINPVDAYKTSFGIPNAIIGVDACGIVQKVGSKVEEDTDVKNGDLVYFLHDASVPTGTFADFVVQDARTVGVVPKKFYEGKDINKIAIEFGSFPTVFLTAYWDLVKKAGLTIFPIEYPSHPKLFKNIVITGASGGVGSYAVQLARIYKETLPKEQSEQVRIIGICSTANIDFAKSMGATHMIDYTKENVVERVREITQEEMADIYVDNIMSYEQGISCLGYGVH